MRHWVTGAPSAAHGLVPEHSRPQVGSVLAAEMTGTHQGMGLKHVLWSQLLQRGLTPCAL